MSLSVITEKSKLIEEEEDDEANFIKSSSYRELSFLSFVFLLASAKGNVNYFTTYIVNKMLSYC